VHRQLAVYHPRAAVGPVRRSHLAWEFGRERGGVGGSQFSHGRCVRVCARHRMEVIELAGYISDEKVYIARDHLQPKVMREAGVPEGATELTDAALHTLIDQYCREPGVRALQQHLERLYRKLALKLVRDGARPAQVEEASELDALRDAAPSTTARVVYEGERLVVDTPQLIDYLGQPKYPNNRPYETMPAGVVTGLAYTGMGGRCALRPL
jgi:Lon-like ATP-dependent protease